MTAPVTDNPADWPIHRLCQQYDNPLVEAFAMGNALLWLCQAARGEVPHGGVDLYTIERPVE
jgi:hypothetical protein